MAATLRAPFPEESHGDVVFIDPAAVVDDDKTRDDDASAKALETETLPAGVTGPAGEEASEKQTTETGTGEKYGELKERVADDGGLTVYSKRSERLRKKQMRKQSESSQRLAHARGLVDLPYELLTGILFLLRPTDIVRLSRACRALHEFVALEEETLAKTLIAWRYPCLAKCLRLPVPLDEVAPSLRVPLQSAERQEMLSIHKKPYQHVRPPDPAAVCTCLTCVLRWNSLCLAVDFARWQGHLDRGDPIPMVPRGRSPAWNLELVSANAAVVSRALRHPLWYACILEAHLGSTARSIRRHGLNKGNRRRRYRMTEEDQQAGTDVFLERSGPPTLDFPFHRDNYYMLEAYLPNRGWNGEESRWMYMPAEQHDRDLEFVERWDQRRREREKEREPSQEGHGGQRERSEREKVSTTGDVHDLAGAEAPRGS